MGITGQGGTNLAEAKGVSSDGFLFREGWLFSYSDIGLLRRSRLV
jgi:hypothetical protein